MPRRVASCWSTPTIPVGPSYVLASRPRASCRSGSSDVAVTGIVGVLQHEATRRGMRGLSVWAAVPHYVAHPPSPKATVALLARLEELLGEPIPLGDLPEDAEAWQHGVDELAAEDSEIAEYIAQLEE